MNVTISKLSDVTIPQSSTTSSVVDSKNQSYDAEAILIESPAALDAGTYRIEVGDTLDGVNATFRTLQDESGTDYVVPAAGKAIVYSLPCWPCWRISGPSAGSARIFKVFKITRS